MTTRTTYSFRVTEVATIFGCKSSGVLRFCRLILSLSGSSSDFVYFWCSDVLNASAMVRHRAGEETTNIQTEANIHTCAKTDSATQLTV